MSRNTLTGDSADHIRQSIEMTAQCFASLRRQRVPAHRFALDVHFLDPYEHEACNKSDELRVVLIFDVWNPLLSDTERKLVNALAEATREYS